MLAAPRRWRSRISLPRRLSMFSLARAQCKCRCHAAEGAQMHVTRGVAPKSVCHICATYSVPPSRGKMRMRVARMLTRSESASGHVPHYLWITAPRGKELLPARPPASELGAHPRWQNLTGTVRRGAQRSLQLRPNVLHICAGQV